MVGVRAAAALLIAAASVAFSTNPAHAATVIYRSDAELIRAAERLLRGVVLDIRFEEDGSLVRTIVTIEVLEDFTGRTDRVVEIRELGGVANGRFVRVDGAVPYRIGEEIVVLLERGRRGHLRTLALGLTKFDVVRNAAGEEGTLVRNLGGLAIPGAPSIAPAVSLASFRAESERIRGVRSVRHERQSLDVPLATAAEPFTLLLFGNGLPARWTEADAGAQVRWYRDINAASPLITGSDSTAEIQTALSAWSGRPQASLTLAYSGPTSQNPNGPWASLGGGGAGVIFYEDPDDEISSNVLAIGGGGGTLGNGGTVNGTTFNRFTWGFVIMQNAADLPTTFRQTLDFTRVMQHEIGHAIGLGHTDLNGNIMVPSCCGTSVPIPPALGSDDLAGLTFVYPAGLGCASSVTPASHHAGSSGGSVTLTVTADAGCAWAISGLVPWITVSGPLERTGPGTVSLSVAANAQSADRTASLLVASRPVTVSQSGCPVGVTPASISFSARGGTAILNVGAGAGCGWAVSQSAGWLLIIPASGTGSSTVSVTASVNTDGQPRTGSFRIGTSVVSVRQSVTHSQADFDGDGWMDLVWHHRTTGALSAWLMNGFDLVDGRLFTPGEVSDVNWRLAGSGDLDGDGQLDLVWQNVVDGRVAGWLMTGMTLRRGDAFSVPQVPDTNWRIVSVGDADRDGRADLYWQHQTDGRISVWLMNGLTVRAGTLLNPSQVGDTSWKIAATADFDRDGHRDLLWRNSADGRISIWRMNGLDQIAGTLTNPPQVADLSWEIRGAGDLNGDGYADIIWQNTADGRVSVWLMRGLDLIDGRLLNPSQVPDTNWRIVGPR